MGYSSETTINNSTVLADITGFGKTTIGFLLISLSTSLPELSVSVFSIGHPESLGISIGNVLGSQIANICLIFGACILYANYKHKVCLDFLILLTTQDLKDLQFGLFAASVIPLTLIYIGEASRVIGIILLLIFIWNTYKLIKNKTSIKDEGSREAQKTMLWIVLKVLIGVTGVISSSYFIVESATNIALSLGIPRLVIGATIVALGTSLPELATSLQASKNNDLNLTLGNIIGSGFINLTFILGTILVLNDLTINISAFTEVTIFALISNMFLWYFLSGDKLCEREGWMLLILYAVYLITSFSGYI
ncbi:sodium:calcium antiporter [Candidatus Bathyarchaeota archaeon]|nr:sodium:calcium antiporter [Candidatus Bathyarchaeota archaeon]